MKAFLVRLVLLATSIGMASAAESAPVSNIGVFPDNPFYWQYQGQPLLLLGGSSGPTNALNDEGMFLWPDVVGSLDKLVAAGGNYTRCLMSGRLEGQPLWPFLKVGDHYDLNRWDDQYWHRFEQFLKMMQQRRIITDIEIWATFDYARLPWTRNPFNPVNNDQYTTEQTGLAAEVKSHPVQTENVFFHTLPVEKNVPAVLKYQQQFVDKILSYTLKYDHVLYCMDNETGASPAWCAYWARYVSSAAAKLGKKVYVTEMFDPHDLNHPVYDNVVKAPETYDFIEISQNNHQSGQTHYDKIISMRQRLGPAPRPLSNVKIYGSGRGGLFGTSQEATERFWRNIFAGCASARFHEKHLGGSELAQRMIRSAREVTGAFDLFHCAPHNELLLDRAPNQAYCLANPGKEYAVYFPADSRIQLDTRGIEGEATVRWYNIDQGQWMDAAVLPGQSALTLTTPGAGQWTAVIRFLR